MESVERQASLLSNISDYDCIDATGDELEDEDDAGDDSIFLKPNHDIVVSVTVGKQHHFAFTGDTLISTRLYDVECTHGGYTWKLVRKYKQFEELHRALRFYRASLLLSRSGRAGSKTSNKPTSITETSTFTSSNSATSSKSKIITTRSTSLKFPNVPEIFISSTSQVEKRRRQLENYINSVLQDPTYRTYEATMKFLEISRLSFTKHGGKKFHEGLISKRSGGRRIPMLLNCFVPSVVVWNKRWLVLKDSYICYLRRNQEIADVMLFDRDFEKIKAGIFETRYTHGLIVTNAVRELSLKTISHHESRHWAGAIDDIAKSCEYTDDKTPNQSFAPKRKELAHWYVDAESYFEHIASALHSAQEEIYIADWWLNPSIFLKRPVVEIDHSSRLDNILLEKARQGVKIYILLYKEIRAAVGGIESMKCKNSLETAHENIKVMRHPDHLKSAVFLWSHHEKIVCVDQRIAFLGGLDLCFGRWDNSQHRLTDLGPGQTVLPPATLSNSANSQKWKEFKKMITPKGTKKKLKKRRSKHTRFKDVRALSASNLGGRVELRPLDIHKSRSHSEYIRATSLEEVQFIDCKDPLRARPGDRYSFVTDDSSFSDVFSDTDESVDEWGVNNKVSTNGPLKPSKKMAPHKIENGKPLRLPFHHDTTVTFAEITHTPDIHQSTHSVNENTQHFASVNEWVDPFVETADVQPSFEDLPIDGEDVEAHQFLRSHSATENFKLADATIPFYGGATQKNSLDDILSVSRNHSSVNSLNAMSLPFKNKPSAAGGDHMDIHVSTGFALTPSVGQLDVVHQDEKGSSDHLDGVAALGSGDVIPTLLLEPIRYLSNDSEKVNIKRCRGKTPTPAPSNDFFVQIESRQLEKATVTKRAVKVGGISRATQTRLNRGSDCSIAHKQAGAAVSDCEQSSVKRKNPSLLRKKIWSNIDKVRAMSRHERSQKLSSAHSSSVSSRKSSTASQQEPSSRFWVGKDYVNWIHKDLDNVDSPFKDYVDRTKVVRMPWHDIACVVFNKAATDVGRHFIQRWNHAKKIKDSSKASSKYPLLVPRSTRTSYKRLPDFIKDQCDLVNCQIVRSCSGWSTGMRIAECSIYHAYMKLIEESQHYIYIENQFFISWCGTEIINCICEALVNRILKAHRANRTFRVYMVLPLLPSFESDLDPQKGSPLFAVLHFIQQSLGGHESSLFQKLRGHGLDPNRYVSVCSLRTHDMLFNTPVTELIYVHSKLMIVDDRKCIIGSANINDRSLLGDRDSEIAVVIEDDLFIDSKMSGEDFQAGKFCFYLRNTLFQEHLGLQDETIKDVTCDEFYKNVWVTTAAVNTTVFDKVFKCLPCDDVNTFNALKQHREMTPLAKSDPVSAKHQLSKVKGHLVMFPMDFLKDETLLNYLGAKENLVPLRVWT